MDLIVSPPLVPDDPLDLAQRLAAVAEGCTEAWTRYAAAMQAATIAFEGFRTLITSLEISFDD